MCVVCGTVWSVFGRVIVRCVWDSLEWVCGSECVVCGTVWSEFGGVSVCRVWDSLE